MTPDSSERLTIFVMTGSSSSREMVGTDDGRGSSATFRFTNEQSSKKIVFLDTEVFKGLRFTDSKIVDV